MQAADAAVAFGVGRHFGYAGSGAAGKQRASLRELMAADPHLAKTVAGLRKKLRNG
jgi:hypothetical protein